MCIPPWPRSHWGVILVSTLCITACSPKLAPVGHYQDNPVTADGTLNNWTLPLRFSNTGYTMQYTITNDDKNVYVCVSSADDNTQLRILIAGMTLYFDPKGEKNKDISLHFPIQKQPDPSSYRNRGGYNQNNNQNSNGSRDTRKEELLLQSDYYNTSGFLDIENGQFSIGDQKGPIHAAMKLNNGDSLLVYEVTIPLKNILSAEWLAKAAKKNFSVGVVIDAIPAMGGGGGGPRPGGFGMRGMGMGGMRGGMGGGGMGGGGRRYGGGQPAQKEDANWYRFRLATK